MRVGLGFDVHRLEPGWPLVLGGVKVPWDKGLVGHSDADVLLHAVIDALLGAGGLGDIGQLFPDTDQRYRGVSSLVLLEEVAKLLACAGLKVVNIDAVLMAQRPRIAPLAAEMAANISRVLAIEPSAVSIKGKTTEGLGFTGQGQGIACSAVALVDRCS